MDYGERCHVHDQVRKENVENIFSHVLLHPQPPITFSRSHDHPMHYAEFEETVSAGGPIYFCVGLTHESVNELMGQSLR